LLRFWKDDLSTSAPLNCDCGGKGPLRGIEALTSSMVYHVIAGDMADAWVQGKKRVPVLIPPSMPLFEPDPALEQGATAVA
jgi:hypothetical protein